MDHFGCLTVETAVLNYLHSILCPWSELHIPICFIKLRVCVSTVRFVKQSISFANLIHFLKNSRKFDSLFTQVKVVSVIQNMMRALKVFCSVSIFTV